MFIILYDEVRKAPTKEAEVSLEWKTTKSKNSNKNTQGLAAKKPEETF